MPGSPSHDRLTVISPSQALTLPDLAELWRGRGLVAVLAQREIRIRYANSLLGVAWSLVTPLALVVAFAIGFGAVAGIAAPGGLPYWLWAWGGVIGWQAFSLPLARGASALIENERLLGRVYLPRLALPISAVITSLIDVAISGTALLATLVFLGHGPAWSWALLPFALLPAVLLGTAGGIALSAVNARYRDLRHALPVLIQLLLLLCPIGYPERSANHWAQLMLDWNPLTPAIAVVRWCCLPSLTLPPMAAMVGCLLAGILLLVIGAVIFRHHERTIVDRM
jgi:lipopolysaccharide transport system permease protein